MSERLELLRPLITPRITQLVNDRLFNGLKFFVGHTRREEYTAGEIKLTLILATIANPKELLSEDERGLLEGGMRQQQVSAEKQQISASVAHLSAQGKKRKKRA